MLFQILIIIFYCLFFILVLKNFNWAISSIIFLLPTYLVRFNLWLIPTNLLEGMIVVCLIGWFFDFKKNKRLKKIISDKIFLLGVLFLLSGLIISTIFSNNLFVSMGVVKGFFLIPMLFALIIFQKAKKKNIPIFLNNLAFSGLILANIAIIYFVLGITTYDGRISAFFNHPNFLAMYLSSCFLISFLNIFHSYNKRKIKFWIISSIIILFALLLTQSAGALLAIAVSLLIYIVINKSNFNIINKKLLLLFFSFLIIIVIVSLPKIVNSFVYNRSSLHSRIMIWKSAFKILDNHWFLGIGSGSFQSYYLDYQKYFSPYLEWSSPQPHNIFLAFWLQLGILGIIGFIMILIWFYRSGFSILKKEALSGILMAIITYILIHGLVDTTYWKNDLSVVFWTTIALMFVLVRYHHLSKKNQSRLQG